MIFSVLALISAALVVMSNTPRGDADAGSATAPAAARPAPPGETAAAVAARWNAQRTPGAGPARAIGAYAAGCLDGAVALPPSGLGYDLLHLGRRRGYGHPTLVDFIRRLAAEVNKHRLGLLLVGDLAQARGGPTPNGHRSHQSGLDVDLGYAFPAWMLHRHPTTAEREALYPPPVVDLGTHKLTSAWQPRVLEVLRLAASDPTVDRIFVNPVVKREVCARLPPGTPWVRKLRPWWAHHDHFHVRLRCPPDSGGCEAQPPVPPDDGCGESLRWWFSEDARSTATRRTAQEPAVPRLPGPCQDLISAQ